MTCVLWTCTTAGPRNGLNVHVNVTPTLVINLGNLDVVFNILSIDYR